MNWRITIIDILRKRDGDLCQLCKKEFSEISPPEIDHIMPFSNGGSHNIENLQLIHSICNRKKGSSFKKSSNIILVNKMNKIDFLKKKSLEETLIRVNGNISQAARELGLSRATMRGWIKKYNLRKLIHIQNSESFLYSKNAGKSSTTKFNK